MTTDTGITALSWPRRLLRLALAIGVLIVVIQFTPYLVHSIPALEKYNQVLEETGIFPGVLFYNDVPQTRDSEMNNRDAIKYDVKHHSN